MNVYERTQQRLKTVFELFDDIYVSFSGGKDSGVLLNLCIDYIRRHHLKRRIGVFHMDYEIQYRDTGGLCRPDAGRKPRHTRRLPGLRAVQGTNLHIDVPALLAPVGRVQAGAVGA